jgi:hypothetical protein
MLLVFGAPCQLLLLSGQEHGRTIPLAVIRRIEIPQRSSLLPYRGVLSFGRKHGRHWAVKRRNFITLLGGATKSGACAGIIEGQAARRREVAAELAVRRYSNKHVARRRRRHVSRDAAIIPL